MMYNPVTQKKIANAIFFIRDHRVMLDVDLAKLYGVQTFRLNEAVKRNIKRFPEDFMFQLNKGEKEEVIANCDNLHNLKFSPHLPYAFTEQGVAMLSAVLNSQRAIDMNVAIMRAFVSLRQVLSSNKELGLKLQLLENKIEKHDKEIQAIFVAIRQLMAIPLKPKKRIGFYPVT